MASNTYSILRNNILNTYSELYRVKTYPPSDSNSSSSGPFVYYRKASILPAHYHGFQILCQIVAKKAMHQRMLSCVIVILNSPFAESIAKTVQQEYSFIAIIQADLSNVYAILKAHQKDVQLFYMETIFPLHEGLFMNIPRFAKEFISSPKFKDTLFVFDNSFLTSAVANPFEWLRSSSTERAENVIVIESMVPHILPKTLNWNRKSNPSVVISSKFVQNLILDEIRQYQLFLTTEDCEFYLNIFASSKERIQTASQISEVMTRILLNTLVECSEGDDEVLLSEEVSTFYPSIQRQLENLYEQEENILFFPSSSSSLDPTDSSLAPYAKIDLVSFSGTTKTSFHPYASVSNGCLKFKQFPPFFSFRVRFYRDELQRISILKKVDIKIFLQNWKSFFQHSFIHFDDEYSRSSPTLATLSTEFELVTDYDETSGLSGLSGFWFCFFPPSFVRHSISISYLADLYVQLLNTFIHQEITMDFLTTIVAAAAAANAN
jgi:hypothetical protein